MPQYQKAVAKARMTQLLTRFNAIEKATRIYFLTNGSFPTDIRDLVLDIAEDAQYARVDRITGDNINGYVYPDGEQCATFYAAWRSVDEGQNILACINKDIALRKVYSNYAKITLDSCAALTAEGEKICASLSPSKRTNHTYDNGFHQWLLN